MLEADKILKYVPLDPSATEWLPLSEAADPPPTDYVPTGDRTPPDITPPPTYNAPGPIIRLQSIIVMLIYRDITPWGSPHISPVSPVTHD